MSDQDKQNKAMQVLGTLAYKNTELTIEEIGNKLLLSSILPSEIASILDVLRSSGWVTETFTVDKVLDADSKSSIRYKITQEGMNRYNSLFTSLDSSSFADPYLEEERAKKKFNRKILIACAIGFIVVIAALIAYIASTG